MLRNVWPRRAAKSAVVRMALIDDSCQAQRGRLGCCLNDQIPPANGGLPSQHIPEKSHGRVFGGKVTGVQQPQACVCGPAGYGVLDLGGDKHVRPLVQSGFGKIGAGAAADGNGCHPRGPWSGFQYPWRGAGLADSGKKGIGGDRCGIGTNSAEAAVMIVILAGRDQRSGIRKAQEMSEVIADTALDRIEVRVAGNDADLVAGGGCNESACGGVGAYCFQGPENDWVVGDDEIVPAGAGLINERTGGVKGQKDAVHRLVRVTDQKTDIVPILGQGFRGDVLENCQKISNGRHSVTL